MNLEEMILIISGVVFFSPGQESPPENVELRELVINGEGLNVKGNTIYTTGETVIPLIIPESDKRQSLKIIFDSPVDWIQLEFTGILGVREEQKGLLNVIVTPPEDIGEAEYNVRIKLEGQTEDVVLEKEIIVAIGKEPSFIPFDESYIYYGVGAIVGIIAIAAVIWFLLRRRKGVLGTAEMIEKKLAKEEKKKQKDAEKLAREEESGKDGRKGNQRKKL